MTPTIVQFETSAKVSGNRAAVFSHWLDPEARQRYEAPEDSGMRYKNFAPVQGGVEVVEIVHAGAVIGEMVQRLIVVTPPALIVSQLTGTFNGVTSMALQITMRFEEEDGVTGIHATSQIVDITGRDVKPEHEAGWAQMFAKFTADFAAHGRDL